MTAGPLCLLWQMSNTFKMLLSPGLGGLNCSPLCHPARFLSTDKGTCEVSTFFVLTANLNKPSMYLTRIDHNNNLMSLETTFRIPEGCAFHQAHGQGRVVGFLIQEWPGRPGPLRAVIIHLDYPRFTMQCEVPPTHTVGGDLTVRTPPFLHALFLTWHNVVFWLHQWSICIPTGSLAIIFSTQSILSYEIPNFSTLFHNANLSSRGVPMWNLPGPDRVDERVRTYFFYMTGEALHDPSSTREFNVHFTRKSRFIQTDDTPPIERGCFIATHQY